jgi:hypothetical protein
VSDSAARSGVRVGDILRSIDDEPLDYRLGCSAVICEHLLSSSNRPVVLKLTRPHPSLAHNLNDKNVLHSSFYHTFREKYDHKLKKARAEASNAKNQNMKRYVERISLVLSVEVADLSVLLLHHHQLFAYAMLQGISLNLSRSPPGGINAKKKRKKLSGDANDRYMSYCAEDEELMMGEEAQEEEEEEAQNGSMSCSGSLQYLNVLDLSPQGIKHRDVVARPPHRSHLATSPEAQNMLKLDFKSDKGVAELNVRRGGVRS